MIHSRLDRLGRAAAALVAVSLLVGCAPVIVGGAMIGGSLVATDRRTSGIQLEDQTIEFKAASRVTDLATLGQVNVVSYNRIALITGEVPAAAEKMRIERAVAGVENVRGVVNELGIGGNSTVGSRSNDTVMEAKIVASFVDTPDILANAYKVVVERAVVYLMGRVTEREAHRGTEIARSVSGVRKVVQVFEIITEEELATLGSATAGPAAAASAPR